MIFGLIVLLVFVMLSLAPLLRMYWIYFMYGDSERLDAVKRFIEIRKNAGKWAVIFGGTADIGHAFINPLTRAGFDLFIISDQQDKFEQMQYEIETKYKVKAHMYYFDHTKGVGYDELAKAINDLESVGMLINHCNTKPGAPTNFIDVPLANLYKVISGNLISFVTLTKIVMQKMNHQEKGSLKPVIVNIGSSTGDYPMQRLHVYGGTSAAMKTISEVLKRESADDNFMVNTFNPSFVASSLTGLESDQDTPTPKDLVMSIMQFVGKDVPTIAGYWRHDVRHLKMEMLPRPYVEKMLDKGLYRSVELFTLTRLFNESFMMIELVDLETQPYDAVGFNLYLYARTKLIVNNEK